MKSTMMEIDIDPGKILDDFGPMIKKLAARWTKEPRVPYEDLVSIGNMAAIEAVATWKETGGASVSTWVYRCARNAIMYFHNTNKYTLHSSVYHQKNNKQLMDMQQKCVKGSAFLDWIASSEDVAASGCTTPLDEAQWSEEWDMIYDGLKEALDDRQMHIVEKSNKWFGKSSMREIGDELGISRQRVQQMDRDIRETLKIKFANWENGYEKDFSIYYDSIDD
jgi:RNA polymerase sigma factor (sigma-70 family)